MADSPSLTVLHLIASLGRGGTELQLLDYIRHSDPSLRHIILAWRFPVSLQSQFTTRPLLVTPLSLGRTSPFDLPRLRRPISETIREQHVNLVVAHLSEAEFVAAATIPRGTPILASRVGGNSYDNRLWYRGLEGLVHRRMVAMVCESDSIARFTREHDLWHPPLSVIPNGIDLARFRREALPANPVIAMVANMRSVKRHDRFLRALALVRRAIPAATAHLIGDGPEMPRIRTLVRTLDLQDAVAIAGSVEDVRPTVKRSRVVALTSDSEGTPNALLEGMAMGRIPVSTAVGGVVEVIRDGVNGFLAEPNEYDVARRLIEALTTSEAERLSHAARARATQHDWQTVARAKDLMYSALARR